jgi:hypothetical protein
VARTEDQVLPTFELEVDEKSDIVGALFTLGQFSENKEASPSVALLGPDSHALNDDCKGVEIAIGDATRAHNSVGSDPIEC